MRGLDLKELLVTKEEFLKAGRIQVAILNLADKDKAIVRELMIDLESNPEKPVLYIKMPDGSVKPVYTESDELFNEFLENFIEVSTVKTKDYQPSLWMMLKADRNGNTGFNSESIQKHYDYIQEHRSEIKPYMLQTFEKGKDRELLIPFVTTQEVYYDLGRLVQNETIKNFDDIINIMWNLLQDIQQNLTDIINAVEGKFNDLDTKLKQENERQNSQIASLTDMVSGVEVKIEELKNTIGDSNNTAEKRIRPKELVVGGQNNTIYPVKLKYTGGGIPISEGGTELFMAPMFITLDTRERNIILQLGHSHMTTSANFYSKTDNYFIYGQKVLRSDNAKFYIYDVMQTGPGEFTVLLRGNSVYKLWSKYVENIEITNNGGTIGGIAPYSDTILTRNPNLTNKNNIGVNITQTFSNSIHVSKNVIIGKYTMKVK